MKTTELNAEAAETQRKATRLTRIMVRVTDDHVIIDDDSIDIVVGSYRAPAMARNVHGAVGLPARVFNSAGLEVRAAKVMEVEWPGGKIVRREVTPQEEAEYLNGRAA